MGPRRYLTPLLVNSGIALAGVVVMVLLLRLAVEDQPAAEVRAPAALTAAESQRRLDRLAFVPPGAFQRQLASSLSPQLKPSIDPDQENAQTWSTQISPQIGAQISPEPVPGETGWRYTFLHALRQQPASARPRMPVRTYTLKTRLAELSPPATVRLAARFEAAKAAWPPTEITYIAIKDEKVLELHARQAGGPWKLIHRYRVLAASGGTGPKLRQGDRQVPEGIYAIAFLNPNSAYHVSLRVNYPNAFDREMAAKDARKDLGGDIMIHGKNLSAGCLAMGDEQVEELFVLAAQTGLSNVKLIISPTDFRRNGVANHLPGQPAWLPKLYSGIATAMADFKPPPSSGLLSYFTK